MSPDLNMVPPPTGPHEPALVPRTGPRFDRPPVRAVDAAARTDEVKVDVLSSTPPPEALAAVDKAAEVVQELRRQGRELHFRPDERSNRIIVEVRDMDGRVLRTIPPSEALVVLEGGPF